MIKIHMKKTLTTTLATLAIATSISFAGFFQNDNIKIKGIYLGMTMEEALVACKQMVQGTDAASWADMMQITKAEDGSQIIKIENRFHVPLLIAVSGPNQNGKLTAFALDGIATNIIFKCNNMGSQEFVKTFIDAYKIPKVEPDEKGENYVYQTDDGTKVIIGGTDKSVALVKVKSQEETKSSFN